MAAEQSALRTSLRYPLKSIQRAVASRQGRFEPSLCEVARQGVPLRLTGAPPEHRPPPRELPVSRMQGKGKLGEIRSRIFFAAC